MMYCPMIAPQLNINVLGTFNANLSAMLTAGAVGLPCHHAQLPAHTPAVCAAKGDKTLFQDNATC